MSRDDFALIETVLNGLWAPRDGDPQVMPSVLDDAFEDRLTVNDVIRARRALVRLRAHRDPESESA